MTDYKNFEEMFGYVMSSDPDDEFNKIVCNVREKVKGYSSEKKFSLGKELANEEEYFSALVIFDELSKTDKKEIADIYKPLVFSMLNLERDRSDEEITIKVDDILTKRIIGCMMESTNMYAQKKISKEEFNELELLIDRIDFKNMRITGREEFNRIYCKFKEYCVLDVYLEK